jgi:hypothetical protein
MPEGRQQERAKPAFAQARVGDVVLLNEKREVPLGQVEGVIAGVA